jgi:uncharacterized protein YjbI with pentapeptide repeats
MNESESKKENRNSQKHRFDPELLKKGLRCDLDQYEFLKECSEKGLGGIEEWNKWRKKNPDEDILLEGAMLRKADLIRANLMSARLRKAKCFFAHFEKANLLKADMSGAQLFAAHLNDAKLGQDMEAVELTSDEALKSQYVLADNIRGLELGADLSWAILWYVDLRGANLSRARLCGADFRWATVDGSTTIRKCQVDRKTDFREVGLNAIKIDVQTKQLLENNIRRMNWEEWYKEHPQLKQLVKPFWWVSDYGLSTGRIIVVFFVLSFLFAAIYANLSYWYPPGIVSHLEVEPHVPIWHYFLLLLLRPLYFSIVTMTTLGFGDMYANAHSIWGHILLSIQVILGYVILGALVTRFAVLFTAGGPAGKFSNDK